MHLTSSAISARSCALVLVRVVAHSALCSSNVCVHQIALIERHRTTVLGGRVCAPGEVDVTVMLEVPHIEDARADHKPPFHRRFSGAHRRGWSSDDMRFFATCTSAAGS